MEAEDPVGGGDGDQCLNTWNNQCSAGVGVSAFLFQLVREGTLGVFTLKIVFVGCWVWHPQATHSTCSFLGLMTLLLGVSLGFGLFSSLF